MASTGAAVSVVLLSLMVVVATADYNVPPPPTTTYTSPIETPYIEKPIPDIAMEGFIFCKSGYNESYPIQGARVKIVCPVVNSNGKLVAKVSISSYPSDLNGYFYFITYGLSCKVKNINGCKLKLESSPISTCMTRTNVNKGITGAPLSANNSKFFSQDNLNVYTFEPFYFSSPLAPKPVSRD